ncbi:MAG: aldo/keto reductase [Opitutales bacterium]|jgi:aryl-alcohol dehydrogenase-like predicted oxidoreductase|nr:aldo/keto reductase [Opitutales bacterium]MBT5170291.1 aldo/keto reductase [Opitutales bacterium]MBT5814112.1 aldo/keto reductase [Opitutales bacterium]MBT6380521.1 aldo/keto reductase [Opitutales bacterium]MBT6769123.1 aldo/keto reductase [Opitutales bacterium]
MKERLLGRTGLTCSEIGLGTWALGSSVYGDVGNDDATRLIGESLDCGINFFDTAPLYGSKSEDGIAETVLGKGLGSRRNEAIISTKFGRTARNVMPGRFNAAEARESCEASLTRLGTDHIDLLFFHSPFGPGEIDDDVWEELGCLRSQGKIRFLGHSVSMYDDTRDMSAQWMQDRRIDAIQVVLSPFNRETRPLIKTAMELDCGVVARECMANGFLSGVIRKDTVFPDASLNSRYSREEIAERVDYAEALKTHLISGDIGSLPQAAYRWVLDQAGVSLALSGARNIDEVRDSVFAANAKSYGEATLSLAESIHSKDYCPA